MPWNEAGHAACSLLPGANGVEGQTQDIAGGVNVDEYIVRAFAGVAKRSVDSPRPRPDGIHDTWQTRSAPNAWSPKSPL